MLVSFKDDFKDYSNSQLSNTGLCMRPQSFTCDAHSSRSTKGVIARSSSWAGSAVIVNGEWKRALLNPNPRVHGAPEYLIVLIPLDLD